MASPSPGGPVFVFTSHRSGGTLLARVLNCHADLVIWGEHGGCINMLADIAATMARHPPGERDIAELELAGFAQQWKSGAGELDPWFGPVTLAGFQDWCRSYLEATFRAGLRPGQRWGFKEIRYHTVATAQFLLTLFPDARFVLLRRDLTALTRSNIMASWSIDRLRWSGALRSEDMVAEAVRDCAYALAAIDHGLQAIAATMPARSMVVRYEALRPDAVQLLADLFVFLGLTGSRALLDATQSVLRSRAGATRLDVREASLSLDVVDRYLPDAVRDATAQIGATGPDLRRLKRFGQPGRFSFLAGDHHVWDTPYSVTF